MSLELYAKLSPATQLLSHSKHLLGFSGGVDSVALFFILTELKIHFDIAIVHYGTRIQANEEVQYAKDLAAAHNKECFIAYAPHFASNFEHNARSFRFKFFDEIISAQGYKCLILAHQLNDYFEWIMMQFTRGSGLSNLLGFDEQRTHYPIVRPLESISKDELYRFCKRRKLRYFEDTSNQNISFKRNYFRHHFCAPLLREFAPGIAQSIQYLQEDRNALLQNLAPKILHLSSLAQKYAQSTQQNPKGTRQNITRQSPQINTAYFSVYALRGESEHLLLMQCDKIAKKCGYVLSAAQRKEICKSNFACKIHYIIFARNDDYVFVAVDSINLYQIVAQKPMSKAFKALCRNNHIPQKLRALLWAEFCTYTESTQNTHKSANDKEVQEHIKALYNDFAMKIAHFFTL